MPVAQRCPVHWPIAVAPPAGMEGYAQSRLVWVRGTPDSYHPIQGRYKRQWAGLDMAMQRIWASHSRAYPYVFHMCKELMTVSARVRSCEMF
jgi:hypothetical protein